jgi:hypothetical protein
MGSHPTAVPIGSTIHLFDSGAQIGTKERSDHVELMTSRSRDYEGCLMTTDDFRHMALSLPGAEELNGLGYPNFRAGRKWAPPLLGLMWLTERRCKMHSPRLGAMSRMSPVSSMPISQMP